MVAITLNDQATHPPLGSFVWGSQGVSYQVTRRYQKQGEFWLTLATDHGPVEMPLTRVAGWSESPPSQTKSELVSALAAPTEQPTHKFQAGDQVCLKVAPSRVYRFIEQYSVIAGRDSSGNPEFEEWGKLESPDGKTAHWKVSQLKLGGFFDGFGDDQAEGRDLDIEPVQNCRTQAQSQRGRERG